MDYQAFFDQLPTHYDRWGEETVQPKVPQFQQVLEQVYGLTTPNVLQLLNLAVGFLEPGELYCEIGCFQGATLIGALLGQGQAMACAVDNFSDFDEPDGHLNQLMANLAQSGLTDQVWFCHQDFEEFFAELRHLGTTDRIGVYFYGGAPDYRSQLMGLLLVQPFLADRALIVVDNSNWDTVQQACWDFIATYPQCRRLLHLPTSTNRHPSFWNGIQILSWDRHQTQAYDWQILQEYRNPPFIQSLSDLRPGPAYRPTQRLQSLLAEALQLQQAGHLLEAEQRCWAVLEREGGYAEAWYQLGVLALLQSQLTVAQERLLRAVTLSTQGRYFYSLGIVFEQQGDIFSAIRAYQEAVAQDPQLADAYNNLGNLVAQHGDASKAEGFYRQAIAANPNFPGYSLNLGNLLLNQQDLTGAIATYEQALVMNPGHPDLSHNLAAVQQLQADPVQAGRYFGDWLRQRGQQREAIPHYQVVLQQQPADLSACLSLAACYKQTDQLEAAIQCYRDGLQHHPDCADFYLFLIVALQEGGYTEAAIALADEAIARLPDCLPLWFARMRILPIIYQSEAEIQQYRERFTHELQALLEVVRLETPEDRQQALISLGVATNFYLAYQAQDDRPLQEQYGQLVHQIMAANYPEWVVPRPLPVRTPTGKIRVGYLSPSMGPRRLAELLLGWLRHADRQTFEISCYYIGEKVDAFTQEFRQVSDRFYHIPNDLSATAQQILDDQLHILVFSDIGIEPLMTQLAGLRLAPIQCTTWAHPVTTGSPTIDYFLSGAGMEPEHGPSHYSEKLVALPHIGVCYPRPELPELTKTRADFGLAPTATLYLCCQSLFKYLPQYDRLLVEIAQRVPQARFVFLSNPSVHLTEQFRQRLTQAFAEAGLDWSQWGVILPRLKEVDYLALNQLCDVFLDTLDWSGGITTLKAIACGLPIVTCPGKLMRGRHSYGILQRLKLPQTIAYDPADYVEIAVRLGLDADWRLEVIEQMQQRLDRLYENTDCVTALEAFYRQVVAS